MSQRTAYVFVFDGFADWEPASALAELRRTFGFATKTIGLSREPVVSMGGLRVVPDLPFIDFEPDTAAILILPGGDSWMALEHPEISAVVRALEKAHRPIAGICAATLALAHAGLLDNRLHTSNGAGFIEKFVPGYPGAGFYRAVPAITDRGVITASGLAPMAFAAEIFRALAPERASWTKVSEVTVTSFTDQYGHAGLLYNPPSTQIVWPVTKALASLAKNVTTRPTSSGVPTLPSGVNFAQVPA